MSKLARPVPKKTKPRHFIKEWRKFRELTQAQLAERVGVSDGNISHLENGNQNYTQPILEALADALQCEPADLLMRNPLQTGAIWTIWEGLDPPAKQQAIEILEVIKKTGSNG